jgi:hypothetical protein
MYYMQLVHHFVNGGTLGFQTILFLPGQAIPIRRIFKAIQKHLANGPFISMAFL